MPLTLGTYGEEMNLRIRQGATFGPFTFLMQNPDTTPVNLTGCTVRGQIRKKPRDEDVVAELVIVITNPTGGEYVMSLTDEVTAEIPAGDNLTSGQSNYVWDMELEDSLGRVIPLYYGAAIVWREVTRDV